MFHGPRYKCLKHLIEIDPVDGHHYYEDCKRINTGGDCPEFEPKRFKGREVKSYASKTNPGILTLKRAEAAAEKEAEDGSTDA